MCARRKKALQRRGHRDRNPQRLSGPRHPSERRSRALPEKNFATPDTGTAKVSFGTEGGLFKQRLDVPVVVCGPGSIEQAHKPDEFIEISQMEAGERFLEGLLGSLKI
nr:hypothetical protein GCM10020185_66110 [Pseudomonas brassicacearum subsp. brassicacearum]